jgi:hypothetical protein
MNSEDFNWLVDQGPRIFQEYAGKWIAVADQEVIGVGDTAPEAAAQAREKKPGARFILEAIDKEADVIYGGI